MVASNLFESSSRLACSLSASFLLSSCVSWRSVISECALSRPDKNHRGSRSEIDTLMRLFSFCSSRHSVSSLCFMLTAFCISEREWSFSFCSWSARLRAFAWSRSSRFISCSSSLYFVWMASTFARWSSRPETSSASSLFALRTARAGGGGGEGCQCRRGIGERGGGGWKMVGGTHIAFSSSSSIEASDSNCDIFAANRLLTYSVGASASAQFQRRSLPTPAPVCTIAMSQSHLRGVQRFLRLHAGGCCCGCCSPAFLLRRWWWWWGRVRGRRRRLVGQEVVGRVGGSLAVHRGLPVVRGVVEGSHGGGDVCGAECRNRGGGGGGTERVGVTAGDSRGRRV